MKLLDMAFRLTNPKTKEATAFYAALTAGMMDVFHRGATLWNVVLLASLAGVGVAGALSLLVRDTQPRDPGSGA
jgi:hypothetical protein